MKRCPHADIQFCPLYIASHDASIPFGCDDGELGHGTCATHRGMHYDREIARMRIRWPGFVERIEWNQMLADRRAQRERNLRLNGIH